ncbi:hypothetical protein PybrP1_006135 [[Pythium] brassicae (nom. inval.)]|nr:hypothetical protein PybrP1_006135 [[Pythium] brassicae (nom. inval.)]
MSTRLSVTSSRSRSRSSKQPAPPSDAPPSLSALDRFLPLWIVLAAALGMALGQLPEVPAFIASATVGDVNVLVGVGLLAMMYPPLAGVRWLLVTRAFAADWRLLALSSAQNWAVAPALMFALSAVFFHADAGFLAGFSLVGCARCIGMVMIWIALAGGDLEYGAALIALNSLLTLALYALYATFLLSTLPAALGLSVAAVPHDDSGNGSASGALHITMSEIAINVGIYMGVPFALALAGWLALVRLKGERWYFEAYAPSLDVVALLALLFTVAVLFASQSQRMATTLAPVLFATVPFAIYFALIFSSTFALSMRCGASYAQCATLAFTATSNNYELSLGVAVATFGLDSDPAMMSVVAALVEIPTMLLLVWASLWAKRRYFPLHGESMDEAELERGFAAAASPSERASGYR